MGKLVIAVAAIVAAALSLTLVGLGAGSKGAASLSLVRTAPLKLAGRHFRPHERVGLTVSVGGRKLRKTLTATGSGRFTAGFATGAGRCEAVAGIALGRAGSHAALKRGPLPACKLS